MTMIHTDVLERTKFIRLIYANQCHAARTAMKNDSNHVSNKRGARERNSYRSHKRVYVNCRRNWFICGISGTMKRRISIPRRVEQWRDRVGK